MLACGNCLLLYSSKKAAILSTTRGPRVLPSLRRGNNPRQYLLSELWETLGLKAGAMGRPFAGRARRGIRSHGASADFQVNS